MPWAQPTRGPATRGREGPLPPPPTSARRSPAAPSSGGPPTLQTWVRDSRRSGDLRSDLGGTGKDWTGRRPSRGRAGSAGKETRPPGRPGRGRGEVSPELPDSERRGRERRRLRARAAPGLALRGRGSAASARGDPAGSLPAPRPRSHESPQQRGRVAGRRQRAEIRPAAPAPVLHLLVPGAGRQRRRHSRPLALHLRRREFPGSAPRGLTLHLLPARGPPSLPAPPPVPARGAGATCARGHRLTGTRAAPDPAPANPPSGAAVAAAAAARAPSGGGPPLPRSPSAGRPSR
ncbi:sterile alpha motif domain-containing protein 1-like [Dama dama]|uniref:sterile alpha motif domain-containing protein 1-like n=1 Tax=Dama dama TaxID=30532 RepID=UPI002A37244C|nr:sterile alpha motif domain-containing protein 1-like [Dama dama]